MTWAEKGLPSSLRSRDTRPRRLGPQRDLPSSYLGLILSWAQVRAGKCTEALVFFCRILDSPPPEIVGNQTMQRSPGRPVLPCLTWETPGATDSLLGCLEAETRESRAQPALSGHCTSPSSRKVSAWKPIGGAGSFGSGFILCPGEGGCRILKEEPERRNTLFPVALGCK